MLASLDRHVALAAARVAGVNSQCRYWVECTKLAMRELQKCTTLGTVHDAAYSQLESQGTGHGCQFSQHRDKYWATAYYWPQVDCALDSPPRRLELGEGRGG